MNKQKKPSCQSWVSVNSSWGEERAITRWLPKRPPARAQVAAVVMVVIIRAPIARVNNARIIMPMPWTAVAHALLVGWKAYDMKGAV
ncbi:MAG: hypothetical protein KA932_07940 [Giesbergeria sp.]|nr:hypothetical protein [Giesbergeria sp.]